MTILLTIDFLKLKQLAKFTGVGFSKSKKHLRKVRHLEKKRNGHIKQNERHLNESVPSRNTQFLETFKTENPGCGLFCKEKNGEYSFWCKNVTEDGISIVRNSMILKLTETKFVLDYRRFTFLNKFP